MWLLDEAATERAGAALAGTLRPGDVVAFSGPLGAGKTTMVRGVLAALGHAGEVPSPTFAIVQPYDLTSVPVAHADLYRIEDPAEIEELGLEDHLFDGALLIEWAERAGEAAWPQALRLNLQPLADGRRALTWVVPGAWEGRWPPQLDLP
jgi:tRNA threonylcarbamoyladenosine biosynthesis protein TsaE